MNSRILISILVGFGALALLGLLGLVGLFFALRDGSQSGEFIGVVRIEEEIGSSLPYLEQFKQLREQGAKGFVLRVDSPGGSVAASQELYEAVKKLKADSIPVVVSMGNVAASGGLYCALSANKIFANPGTITGSIGVISQFPEASRLMDKIGVSVSTIKSGANKDLGNPYKPADPAQLKVMELVIMDAYSQFWNAIISNRTQIDTLEMRKHADGRVMTGAQAYKLGLIDSLGTYDDAVALAKKLANLDHSAETQEIEKPNHFLKELLQEPANSMREALLPKNRGLWYLAQ